MENRNRNRNRKRTTKIEDSLRVLLTIIAQARLFISICSIINFVIIVAFRRAQHLSSRISHRHNAAWDQIRD